MLEKLTEEEFNEFASNHELSIFFQSSYWGHLKESTGWNSHLVGIKEDGKIKGASLLLSKKIPVLNKYIYYSPRGFLLDYQDIEFLNKYVSEIKKYVKSNKGIFIKINPLINYQERDINGDIVKNGYSNQNIVDELKKMGFTHTGLTINYGKDLEPRWISVLDLKNKNIDDIISNYRSTTRWDVKNSYKNGLKLVEIDLSRMNEFKRLMEHTGERRGFIDRPLSYYNKMYEEFSKTNNIKVMLVELDIKELINHYKERQVVTEKKIEFENSKKNKKESLIKELYDQFHSVEKKLNEIQDMNKKYGNKVVVAGGLFMLFGKQVVSLFGASYKEFMKYRGQYFLNNEMIKYAIENGYEKYNFYGITGEFNEDSLMFGLFDYKRSFGAEVNELIGEFTLVTNKLYNILYKIMFKIYKKIK